MPTEVLPIADLAKIGLVMDTPSVSLPPNAFSDCQNVRFRDGAIRKMEGESEIIFNIGESDLIFVAWWPEPSLSPTDGYYVVVGRRPRRTSGADIDPVNVTTDTVDEIYLFQASDFVGARTANPLPRSPDARVPVYNVRDNTHWQHTIFGGGTTFIINNRTDKPQYIINPMNGFFDLPGWDSYLVDEQITSFFYDTAFLTDNGTDLGAFVNLPDSGTTLSTHGVTTLGDQDILIAVVPADTRIAPFQIRVDNYLETATAGVAPGPVPLRTGEPALPAVNQAASVGYDPLTGTTFLTFAERRLRADGTVYQQGVLSGDSVTIRIQTQPEIQVRAGVIRTYGDLLVAGNLTEMQRSDPARVVRNLPGVLRTSDVAAPGSIPANWNPFKTGVNTAEEITLSSTGIIQDMAELQGILYVYTNESIHSLQQTGNPTVPFNVRPVARGWGAQTVDAVQEFDGKHIVVGTNDIYIFAGHPGSISSIADMRVRRQFFRDLNPEHEQNLFTLLYRRRDEIWINYPSRARTDGQCDTSLIWNYRNNTWTIRRMSPFWFGVTSPIQPDGTVNPNDFFPLLTSTITTPAGTNNPDSVFVADAPGNFTTSSGIGYDSYIERKRLAITPEFTTENLMSIVLLTESEDSEQNPRLEIKATGTEAPSEDTDLSDDSTTIGVRNTFFINTDYKIDLREHGRLLNFRISDEIVNTGGGVDPQWTIAGMQFDIGKGGTR